jgi:type VI protein secretion system component Hcp
MDNAEVYLALVRPSFLPIGGEATMNGFEGQVELNSWTWAFHNQDEKKDAEDDAKEYSRQDSHLQQNGSRDFRMKKAQADFDKKSNDLNRDFRTHMAQKKFSNDNQRDEFMNAYFKKLSDLNGEFQKTREDILDNVDHKKSSSDDEDNKKIEELDRNKNFEFTFSKRVDIATSQLLNSMKAGDIFPTGVLTVHQRSANAGLSLVITVQKLRLLDYALKVEVSDTMTDLREEWVAEFASLAYVYKNRKQITGNSNNAAQVAAQTASQGTVRAFTMKNIGSPL